MSILHNASVSSPAMIATAGRFSPVSMPGMDHQAASFSGSVAEWCAIGYSICESYLLEVQSLYLDQDLAGFRAMIEAQFDPDLEQDMMTHANALLSGTTFQRLAGHSDITAEGHGADTTETDLNWQAAANLWRAMEATKGDMRMPRLDVGFEKQLRNALRLL